MIFPENIKLFTIREVCHACGVSRTTLIRMEESGFLKPRIVDPNTGYRYYDLQNIAAVGQYQYLNTIGLSRKEIADLYYEQVDSRAFLKMQRERLSMMQRFLDQYELRHDHTKNYSISYVSLSAVTCFCTDITTFSPEETATLSYIAHEKCVKEGYRMLGSEPLFGIPHEKRARMDYDASEHHYTFCIPVIPDSDIDPQLRFFPATEAISIIGFDAMSTVPELWDRLWEEFDSQGLEAAAPARFIALVAPYSGAHYKADDFCYECVIPIKERKNWLRAGL